MAVADYAEKDAEMLMSTGNSQTGEHTFTRGWKQGTAVDRKASIEAELRAILVVANPKTDRGKSEHLGTYDVVASGWDGKYLGYIQTLKKRMPYTLPEVVISDDVFSTTTEQQSRNQESPATSTTWIGAFVAGVSKMVSAAADAMKKWTVEIRKTTSKYSLIHYSFASVNGYSETHYICRNERPNSDGSPAFTGLPAVTLATIRDMAGTPSRNPDGTWNWYVVIKPSLWGEQANGVTWKEGTVKNCSTYFNGQLVDLYRYTIQTQVTTKVFGTIEDAITYSQSGEFGCVLPGMSPYHIVGPGQILGTKCDSYEVPIGVKKWSFTLQ